MHRTSHTKADSVETAATTNDYKPSSTGKSPNPYYHYAHTHLIDRNIVAYKQTNNSFHKLICKHTNPFTKTYTPNNNPNHNKRLCLLHKAQLHAQNGGGDISTKLKDYHNICNFCIQQMAHRGKAVHDAIMRSPTDTNMEDTDDTMMIETTQAKRTQEAKKGSSSSKRKKNAEITTGLKETPKEFWLGIMAMEKLADDEGVKTKDCRPPTKKEDLINMGIKEEEA